MLCVRCNHANDPTLKLCGGCGARLGPPCAACAAPTAPADRFCSACGTPLRAGPVPSRPAPPRYLARKIWSVRDALAGERKQVTVLFADLKDSLELLADRDPEDARALLDSVLKLMMEAVHRFEGTVNQVMGDGIMALFGAPLAHEDHAVRACYAALRMHGTVARYAEELARQQGITVRIRIGLNSGEVVVRSIDNDLHLDYTAVGQTTHLAARMEQLARPGTTLITEATRRLAERHVVVDPLGAVAVKGLGHPIDLYELRGGVIRDARAPAPGQAPFIGRERELLQLRRLVERVAAGAGEVATVAGEAGIGKSRLLAEVAAGCRGRGWTTLEGSGVSYGRGTPYLPFVTALKRHLGIGEDDHSADVHGKLSARLRALGIDVERAVPAILAVAGLPVADRSWDGLEPSERRQWIFQAVTDIVVRESARQPVLLVLENVHWIDAESRALLDHLADAITTARVLLVVSTRPDPLAADAAFSGGLRIELNALPAAGTTAMLHALLGPSPELAPLKTLLVARADGNPFFLEESVRTLAETGVLTGERGAYRVARALTTTQIPDRVQALLAARVDRLPEEDKSLLQAAAVIGKDVPLSLLEAVSGVNGEDLLRALNDLEAGGFLHRTSLFPDLTYGFRHALTHDVVYGSQLRDQRRAFHARVHAALRTLYGGRLDEHAERLAHHAVHAELWQEALPHLRQAATKAVARAANVEAIAFLESALAVLGHLPEEPVTLASAIDTRLDLVTPLLQLGRLDAILALATEAERLAGRREDAGRLARTYACLVNYHYLKGHPGEALAYGERCLALAQDQVHPEAVALARRYIAHSHHAQGDYRRAAGMLEESLAGLDAVTHSRDAGVATGHVAACAWLAFALAELGDFEAAERWADRARELAETREHPYPSAIAWTMSGLVAAARGELATAVSTLTRALQMCREAALAVWQPVPSLLLGQSLAMLGRAEDALPLLEDGVRLCAELGVQAYLARWTAMLGGGRLAVGDTKGARACAERALDLARAHGERGHEAYGLELMGDIAAREAPAQSAMALTDYAAALALAEPLGMRPLVARVHLGVATVHRQAGNRAAAEEHLTRAIVMLGELGMRFWLERAARDLAALGDVDVVVVARSRASLYERLTRLAADARVRIVLDRRQGERRGQPAAAEAERRRAERRRARDRRIDVLGLAVVTARFA